MLVLVVFAVISEPIRLLLRSSVGRADVINLRYHIVSITAVFLALGIGLAFGAAFIDRATVDQLERNLNRIESENTRPRERERASSSDRLESLNQIDAELRAAGLA